MEVETAARSFRDTQLKVTMVFLVLISVGAILIVGLLFRVGYLRIWSSFLFGPGLLLATGFGALLALLYRRLRRVRVPRVSMHPGEVECPQCGSVQTDQVEKMRPDGEFDTSWVCFACNHRWLSGRSR
jgi:hypothetical protein